MANIHGIEVSGETYDLEDTSARSTATTANEQADYALDKAAEAKSETDTVKTSLDNLTTIVNAIKGELHPVGSVYITYVNTNPGTLLGFGTWVALSDGYLRNNATNGSGGSLTSGSTALSIAQMPAHNHGGSTGIGLDSATKSVQVTSGSLNLASVPFYQGDTTTLKHSHTISSQGSGQGHTHSIEPTYTRVYAWRRTA